MASKFRPITPKLSQQALMSNPNMQFVTTQTLQSGGSNLQPGGSNLQPGIPNLQPGIPNLQLGVLNLQPGVPNLQMAARPYFTSDNFGPFQYNILQQGAEDILVSTNFNNKLAML